MVDLRLQLSILRWRIADGDNTLRVRYPLTRRSVVWDVGGFVGEWAQNIHDRYHAHVVIFEPTRRYVQVLRARFKGVPGVAIRPYGLDAKTTTALFSAAGLDSSKYKRGTERVRLRDVAREVRRAGKIDLMKLNIEGAEYDVLERLIATGEIRRIGALQVQFHAFVPDARQRRAAIAARLRATHRRTFCFPFIWEGWQRR